MGAVDGAVPPWGVVTQGWSMGVREGEAPTREYSAEGDGGGWGRVTGVLRFGVALIVWLL